MEATRSKSFVDAVRYSLIVKAADHEGFHHSNKDWWIFDARETSPKTCEVCLALHLTDWRGDWVLTQFPDHTHQAVNVIRAVVHPNCRCRLRWAGRSEGVYEAPLGEVGLKEVWRPSAKELEKLSPSQLKMIYKFLREPLR
jgi:hypothetical protein